jgi:hypothetical protein
LDDEADARLIAAAPELVEALKVMVQQRDGQPLNAREIWGVNVARAAVAKAEGA